MSESLQMLLLLPPVAYARAVVGSLGPSTVPCARVVEMLIVATGPMDMEDIAVDRDIAA